MCPQLNLVQSEFQNLAFLSYSVRLCICFKIPDEVSAEMAELFRYLSLKHITSALIVSLVITETLKNAVDSFNMRIQQLDSVIETYFANSWRKITLQIKKQKLQLLIASCCISAMCLFQLKEVEVDKLTLLNGKYLKPSFQSNLFSDV